MFRTTLTVAAACVVVGMAVPSSAGQVKLEIRGGLVTLEAKDATLREIFAEWGRVGKTHVVNAETAPGGPLTLQLSGVSERHALEVILRSVGGFLAIARTNPLESASMYDRIVVMPVARPATAAVSAGGRPVPQPQQPSRDRIVVPPPMVVADDEEEPQVAPMPGQGPYGGAQAPGMPTMMPVGGIGQNPAAMQNPNIPQASQTPRPPPAAQPSPRPGMVTAPVIIKPPGPSGEIR